MTALLACEEAKKEVVVELLAGRLTLAEAATRFHDINNRQPGFNWTEHHRNFTGRSDEEREATHASNSTGNRGSGNPRRLAIARDGA